jgi:nucleoside-diphosphate-sugar epimerase
MRMIITGGSGFIGTNLVERFTEKGWEVINLDVAEPRDPNHSKYWRRVDILDRDHVVSAFCTFRPEVVLHMAARTDLDESRDIKGYAANIDGVENVIEAVRQAGSVERTVFASSRMVTEIGYMPKSKVDYKPSTLYGESKVQGEKIVRRYGESFGPWVIVRPTSIWGPWFHTPYKQFFDSISRGVYVHPGRHNPRKSFGYVGNAVYQIEQILKVAVERVDRSTLWLCDYPPVHLKEWADQIQTALGAKPIRTVPLSLLRPVAAAGDIARVAGWKNFPLTRFRLNNIISEMVYDTSDLESIAGPLPFSTRQGIAATVAWLRTHDKLWNPKPTGSGKHTSETLSAR